MSANKMYTTVPFVDIDGEEDRVVIVQEWLV